MLSLHSNRQRLLEYFPKDLKVFEFNPSNDLTKPTTLSDAGDWLFALENKSFVFQCLPCLQEMEFKTVFWTHLAIYNRSHMLTKKHKNRIKELNIIGLVFNSGKKFILCTQNCFQSGKLFERMQMVKRQDEKILKNPSIVNQAFGRGYSFHTFDRKNCKLNEFEYEDDFVKFMQLEVKPLFRFHCMLCNIAGRSYTRVIQHLLSIKHKREIGTGKVALLSIRDFNIFLACRFDLLTTFTYLEHPNKLKEVIIGSNGSVLISGICTNDDNARNCNTIAETSLKSIKLPDDSVIVNTAVHVRTPGRPSQQVSDDALVQSHTNYENNFTIYEFSDDILKDSQADNLLYSVLSSGCRVWCSRCSTGIYTMEEFEEHLKSALHKARVRSNEQVGFMCHTCKVFFIELKGELLSHIHKSTENMKIMQVLDSVKNMICGYNSPLNNLINNAYALKFLNFSEVCYFACLACCDLAKKKLSSLSEHESNKEHTSKYVFVLCKYCNVVYIDEGDKVYPPFFIKEHFETHIHPTESSTIHLWEANISTKEMYPFNLAVNSKPYKIPFDDTVPFCTNILVSCSKYFSQLVHPGVSLAEFGPPEKWTETCFSEYVSLFYPISKGVSYKCLRCNESVASTSTNASEHCFKMCPKKNPLSTTYIKLCNICNELLMAGSLDDLQQHFLSTGHILVMLKLAGISNADVEIKFETISECRMIFPTKAELLEIVNKQMEESKLMWENKNQLITAIRKDAEKVLNPFYPNAVVEFYGSQMSGLAVEDSDIDICFNVDDDDFKKIESLIKNAKDVFTFHLSLPEARKPIFRLTHRETNKNCDVCLSLTWENSFSKLVKLLVDYDSRVHWLLIAVRYWAKMAKLRVPQVISSNGIIWLVLFYLMQPDVKILPHISYIFEAWGGQENIMNKDLELAWSNSSAGREWTKLELLRGFFHFYSLLDFSRYALSPYTASVLPRTPGDTSAWHLQDPFTKENIFATSTPNACHKFQALSYIILHMKWRIC